MADEVKTPEQQLEEAQARIKELEDLNSKQKAAIDNACSDAAKYKKAAAEAQEAYKAKLTEQEKAAYEAKQREEQMTAELNSLKAEKRVASYTVKLTEAGFDPESAAKMAASLPDGVGEDFFNSQKAFLEEQKQKAITKQLDSQPGLSVGVPPSTQNAQDKELEDLRRWANGR